MEPLPGFNAAERDYLEPPDDGPDPDFGWDDLLDCDQQKFDAGWLDDHVFEVYKALSEARRHPENASALASQWQQARDEYASALASQWQQARDEYAEERASEHPQARHDKEEDTEP